MFVVVEYVKKSILPFLAYFRVWVHFGFKYILGFANVIYVGRDINVIYVGRDINVIYVGRDINVIYVGRDINVNFKTIYGMSKVNY